MPRSATPGAGATVAADHCMLRDRQGKSVGAEDADEAALEDACGSVREGGALVEDRCDRRDAVAARDAKFGDAALEDVTLDLAIALGAVERLLDLFDRRDRAEVDERAQR